MQPQWQQNQQYPYQQAQPTGAQPGGYGQGNPSFLNSQPTGFPGGGMGQMQPMQTGFQRPQQTGFQSNPGAGNYSFLNQQPQQSSFRQGGLAPQATGFPGGGASGLLPQQTGFQMSSQQTGFNGMAPQQTGYPGGLTAQATGYPGAGRLQPQPTGLPHDPRLQSMMQSFMPSNMSQPFAPSGMPQFNTQQTQLPQTFQSLLQNPAVNTPKVPWTLTRQEKKDYDQIFRAWDRSGDGFINGDMAREVFGQSGLGQDDLMKIWNLSDVDNRGKLNLPEFHVAMGLIYRALNGNQIPDTLPEELIPASMRDIDTTVNFMKDLLRHEASTRSSTSSPSYGGAPTPSGNSKDALLYKHSDERPSTYKPSSRHLDRKSVRYSGEDPDAGLQDIRRKLQNTSTLLEKSAEKSAEDEELEEEIESLQYRVKRIQDDIEYTSKGRRTAEKDEERRKLERELLFLMHEKLPELERRQERRKEEKAMEDRAGVRRRDDRNTTHGRFDNRDEYDRDRYRGTFDRERSRDRYDNRDGGDRRDSRDRDYDRYDRDRRDDSRDRRGSYDRPRSPAASRDPPPAPPPAAVKAATSAPPPPAPPSQSPAPSTKNMTPEERKAFIREQAQRRINERLRALGVESAPTEEAVDTSVQDRLELEKKEAEEKSQKAEAEQAARDDARKKRLAEAGGVQEDEKPKTAAPPSPAQPLKSALKKPAAPPPAPQSRAKAPPAPPQPRAAAAPTPSKPAEPEEDPEERELRQKEEAAAKVRAERRARLEALMKEEEEEKKQEEALLAARQNKSKATPAATQDATPPPPPPPAPPAPPAPTDTSYNPFRKPSGAGVTATPSPAAPATGGFNPFFKPPGATTAAAPAAPAAPAPPPAPPAPPAPAPAPPRSAARSPPVAEPEWEDITEKQADSDEDSSDDEYTSSRAGRQGLAQALFGNILPAIGIRPGTASPAPSGPPSAPPAPKAPPAALAQLGGGDVTQSRGALLSAIQGGARLRKAQTVDKSGPPAAGKVIGDTAPPEHINAQPRVLSPSSSAITEESEDFSSGRNANRQSVDWYAGLAADASQPHPAARVADSALATTKEEEEFSTPPETGNNTPQTNVEQSANDEDELADFDMTTTIRVRSLYAFDGTRDVDLSFKEDVVLAAHPAKDSSSAWWYGMLVKEGSKGWFPKDYVEEMSVTHAKALYSYTGTSEDQLPFAEGDMLAIVDKSDPDWWKTEKAGVIFLVPASYLEVQQGSDPVSTIKIDNVDADRGVEAGRDTNSPIPVLTPKRPRAISLLSVNSIPRSPSLVTDDEGDDSSSDDSVLSWWSSDQDDDADDSDNEAQGQGEDEREKEVERKRREEERQKILSAAGLQLKKEPPLPPNSKSKAGSRIPSMSGGNKGRRRAAPGVPPPSKTGRERRSAPAVPQQLSLGQEAAEKESPAPTPPLETQDAYARYEAFLAQSQSQTSPPVSAPIRQNQNQPVNAITRPRSTSNVQPSSAPLTTTQSSSSTSGGGGGGGRLSGFFKGIMTPHSEYDATNGNARKIISGPISRVESDVGNGNDPSTGTTGTSQGGGEFGKTWGSLVEPSVLETMSTKERKRQEAIFEFIATEATYNRDLQLIVEVFYAPLLSELEDKALTVIFANVEDILLFNTSFLSSLEERQKSCRLYIDRIGDVLLDHLRNSSVYMTYCVNQHQASKLLQSLRQSNPKLDAHLQNIRETNSAVRGLDLSSYLLIPMQRITRYPLLLKQIIAYSESIDNTPTMNDDLALVHEALNQVESIVGRINESVREAEGEERLRVLSEDLWIGGEGRLDLTAPTALLGPRRLLKEGKITKNKSGRKLWMVLCNDILVLMDERDLYRMPIPLHELDIRKSRDESGFTLRVDRRRGGDTIGLKAANGREAKEWIAALTRARAKAIDARGR